MRKRERASANVYAIPSRKSVQTVNTSSAFLRIAFRPDVTVFSLPTLAKTMISRALDAGTPAARVTADEVYGQDPALPGELAGRGLLHPGWQWPRTTRSLPRSARTLRSGWQNGCPPGPGSGSPLGLLPRPPLARLALIGVTDPAVTKGGGPHWLLIHCRVSDGEYAFYRASMPLTGALARLVKVAGSHWKIEERGRRRQGTGRPGRAPDPQPAARRTHAADQAQALPERYSAIRLVMVCAEPDSTGWLTGQSGDRLQGATRQVRR